MAERADSLPHGFRAHPWHGVHTGDQAPRLVNCFIEIVPDDTVKFELDKSSGYLRIDRPQQFSNQCPTLYGLIPRTLCDERVAELCRERSGRDVIKGDQDPMDICVLSDRRISHGDILVQALPIGGLRMIDGDEADDKIVAVLRGDALYGAYRDIADCPQPVVDRLRHYFLTYKQIPDRGDRVVEIADVYGVEEAYDVINRSRDDYRARFG
jgi:inorganic pyrophosphatase